ncbi:LOW QUALITY PROTEIN: hypothetical protein IFM46972_03405 [Aspergillus udagawae]|uniref:Uncharacterized protein n=1 Tax=Aspergillus udagawae TaxID=91492 RepID=A0A8H3NFD4_9EURO|nr:LOW QUALITY PROTEIN: hypothetical protein IFM46972_03405 [Aspergillus udagawae]
MAQPGLSTTEHTFEYRFIHKATAKEEIDAAAAEGSDFYFNFMSATLNDPVAGILESRYFESLNLPSCGIRSWERSMTKNNINKNARRRAAPPVPGTDRFPLLSACHNQAELEGALRRAEAMGIEDTNAFAESYNLAFDDIVIQEYIDGEEYTCTVFQMGDACIALTPFKVGTKERTGTEKLKFDGETRMQLLRKKVNPFLFERLQSAAIDASMASGCQGSNMGSDIEIQLYRFSSFLLLRLLSEQVERQEDVVPRSFLKFCNEM